MIGLWVIIILLIIYIITLFLFDFELLSPGPLICSIFILGSVGSEIYNCLIGYKSSGYAGIFIIFSILTFIIFSYLIKRNYKKYSIQLKKIDNFIPLSCDNPSFLTCMFFVIIVTTISLFFIKTCVDELGLMSLLDFSGIGSSIREYKIAGSSSKMKLLIQFTNTIIAVAYVFGIIYIKNIIYGIKNNNYFTLSTFFIIFFFVITKLLMGGSRLAVCSFFGTMFIAYYMIWHFKNSWKKSISLKFINKIIIAFICFLFLFVAIRPFIGRKELKGDRIILHLLHYIGGGITSLDWLLDNQNVYKSENIHCLRKIRGIWSKSKSSDERVFFDTRGFFWCNGYMLGNVYTPIYRYWHDFGYVGVLVCYAFTSLLISSLYYYLKNAKKIGIIFFIYCYLIICILLQAFDDYLFNYIISFYLVQQIILTLLIFKILKIKRKNIEFINY